MGNTLQDVISQVLLRYGKIINDRVVNKWRAYGEVTGNARALPPTIDNQIANTILLNLSYSGQKAWIVEFGKGSKLDKNDNPFLEAYKKSANFNRTRLIGKLNSLTPDFAITSREPKSVYKDLDGKSHVASDKFPKAGFNLEYWIEKYHPELMNHFSFSPKRIIQDEVKFAIPEITLELQKSCHNFMIESILGGIKNKK